MCVQTSSKKPTTMTNYEYWETRLPRNCICRVVNANAELVAIQARNGFVDDFLDCNL